MIPNNPELFDRLLFDLEKASEIYKPTNYWQVYEERLVPTIRDEGISEFRSSINPVFASMGVTQIPWVLIEALFHNGKKHPALKRIIVETLKKSRLYQRLVSSYRDAVLSTLKAFHNTCFQLVLQCDPEKEILKISDSGFGSPRDLFVPEGFPNKQYTLAFLRYFFQYLWVKRFVNFKDITTILELGSGYGGQAEVLLKLYPKVKYIVCDIPPQIYVAEQYLKSVFPREVTGYMDTMQLDEIDLANTKRITVLASWQTEKIVGKASLFWSSATFQEMEPHVVRHYVEVIKPLINKYVYLLQISEGQRVAKQKGEVGVLEPTRLQHYLKLFDDFDLVQQEHFFLFTGSTGISYGQYDHMLFQREMN